VQIRTLLSPACIQLHEEFPKVTMRVIIGTNDELLPALRRGELDVAICGIGAHPRKDLVQERLYEERCVVFAAPTHPLAAQKKPTIGDLAGAKWALTSPDTVSRRMLQRALESAGLGPLNVVMESMALPPKLNLIAATDVLGFSPWQDAQESVMQRNLVEIPISGLRVTRPVGVSYRRDAYLPPAARRFVDIVKRKARELVKLKGPA
jgi:DNA-binding transcriptional LysR family regulator